MLILCLRATVLSLRGFESHSLELWPAGCITPPTLPRILSRVELPAECPGDTGVIGQPDVCESVKGKAGAQSSEGSCPVPSPVLCALVLHSALHMPLTAFNCACQSGGSCKNADSHSVGPG